MENRTIEQMTGEEIAIALNNNWNQVLQSQNNIQVLNAELSRRQNIQQNKQNPDLTAEAKG